MKKTQKSAKERVMRKLRVIGALQIAAKESAGAVSIATVVASKPSVNGSGGDVTSREAENQPEGLLTTMDLESSLPNGFQSKVLRNSSSVY